MVIKALYYFLAFFFIVIIILLTQEPYSLDILNDNDTKPTVEFKNIENYNIDEKGIQMYAKADDARRYKDRDILFNLDGYMQKDTILETLKSNNATMQNNMIYLNGDVVYTRNETLTLKTEAVEYNQTSEILTGKTAFVLEDARTIANGDSFVYDAKIGKIEADNMRATIKMEN